MNCFGEPLFRIIWGQTETMQVASEYGYEHKLIGHNQPCWILQKWMPPEAYGTPDTYYALTADQLTGLPLLGEYPEFGRYETLVTFSSKRYDPMTNELIIDTIPLDWEIIERAIPALLASQEMTYWEVRAAQEAEEAYENACVVSEISDRLHDQLPTFYGPTSHAQIGNRTALIDRKMAQIDREWRKRAADLKLPPRKGFYQGN